MVGSSQKSEAYYLLGNIADAKGLITSDKGKQQTTFSGETIIKVLPGKGGALTMSLLSLNLLSPGVQTKSGSSGVIGLNLEKPPYKINYDQKTGALSSDFRSILHYDLIDKVKGFIPGSGKEEDVFYPYVEKMSGKINLKMPQDTKFAEGATTRLDGEITLTLSDPVLGALQNMRVVISIRDILMALTEPADVLRVQPVFIGTGPSDPTATGTVYLTLIRKAADMWSRCGSVRCLSIITNDPIYINNDDYRVIEGGRDAVQSGTSQAYDLMDEVNVVDAVEVFVVERWDPYYDGGGATWSSGTASAKIVTCDQQLDVPCPPPSSVCSGGSCGDVNYYHLAHELGHVLDLTHPGESSPGRPEGSAGSVLEPSGFCLDNPNAQSARNCREASNPLLYSGRSICTKSPEIMD